MNTEPQVPQFQATVLQQKSPYAAYAVCVFVINEGKRVQAQLTKMRETAAQAGVDIIVADGGSTDGSLAPEFLRECNVRALLTKLGPGKLSAQMRMALSWCLTEGYQGVIVVDGNDKDDTAALPLFATALADGYDHVQGSRYVPGGKAINTPFARHWGVKLLHAPFIAMSAGFPYSDTTNGFRAYSRRLLEHPQVLPFRDVFQKYELHYYLAIRAARLGLKVKEVPVTRAYPYGAPTPTKISPLKGNLLILRTVYDACRGAYNPKPGKTGS